MSTLNVNRVVDSSGGVLAPISSVMRNRIINGQMVINQRGWSGNITTGNEYTLDRFQGVCSVSSKFSVAQSSTAPTGFNNSLLVASTSAYTVGAAEQFLIRQSIEAYNTNDLGWGTASAKTVTLSFQVYSSLTGTFGGALFNSNGSRSYPFTYTVSSANTWTSISVTIAGDTSGTWAGTNGVGITVVWGLGVGSTYSGTAGTWAGTYYSSATGATSVVGTNGATFYITGVQLEVGTQATGFEYVNYQTSLANCQRYFTRIVTASDVFSMAGRGEGTNGAIFSLPLNVALRASPTVTTTSLTAYGPSTAIVGTASTSVLQFNANNPVLALFNDGFTGLSLNNRVVSVASGGGSTFTVSAEL